MLQTLNEYRMTDLEKLNKDQHNKFKYVQPMTEIDWVIFDLFGCSDPDFDDENLFEIKT